MTPIKAIEVLKNERDCVARNIASQCDRNCTDCDLVLPDKDIIEAYNFAINKLRWYYGVDYEKIIT